MARHQIRHTGDHYEIIDLITGKSICSGTYQECWDEFINYIIDDYGKAV